MSDEPKPGTDAWHYSRMRESEADHVADLERARSIAVALEGELAEKERAHYEDRIGWGDEEGALRETIDRLTGELAVARGLLGKLKSAERCTLLTGVIYRDGLPTHTTVAEAALLASLTEEPTP